MFFYFVRPGLIPGSSRMGGPDATKSQAVLEPIYGEDRIKVEEPLSASLNEAGDTWIVSGRLTLF
jgi:hypothetical protein